VLAPYHTYYPTLEEHMRTAPGRPQLNPTFGEKGLTIFNATVLFAASDRSEGSLTVYRELPPQDFFTFTVPFSMQGSVSIV